MALELAWGRVRRALLRRFYPGYVRGMLAKRQGHCPEHDSAVIDARDLKYLRNVCEFWFRPEDDRFVWRSRLGLARYGLAEVLICTITLWILGGCLAFLAAAWQPALWIAVLFAALVWLEIVFFFRDPERSLPGEASALVSPADGTVTHVEEVEEPDFPGGKALRISIFLSIFNVHVNRIPRSGKIVQLRYFPGAYLDARNPASAERNEQFWIDMEEAGQPLRVKQISGAIARRIVCWLKEGETVRKGERLGMIKLGSRTDLLIPVNRVREICVEVGDKVQGCATTLLHVIEASELRLRSK